MRGVATTSGELQCVSLCWLRAAAWRVLVAAAALLLWRRVAGALVQPLGGMEFVGGALLLVAWRAGASPAGDAGARSPWQATAAAGLALGCLSLPGTPWGGLVAGWMLWFIAELWQSSPAMRELATNYWRRFAPQVQGFTRGFENKQLPGGAAAAEPMLRQELQHLVDAQGRRLVNVRLIEPLTKGQLNVTLHVALSPPLPGTPDVQWEQVAGPPARWSAPLALPHGFRLEGKLASPAAPGDRVEIEVQATSAAR